MSYSNTSDQAPMGSVTLIRWQKWRIIIGFFLFLIGAVGTAYGAWIFRTVDGTSMETPVQGDTPYHPARVVLEPILKQASARGWTAQETASALNQVTQGLVVMGGAMFLTGIFLILTSRRRLIGIPRYSQQPLPNETV